MNCEVPLLLHYYSGITGWSKFIRYIKHFTIVNKDDQKTKDFLKSKSAIKRELTRQLSQFPNIIHPFSRFRYYWEIIMMVVYFVTFIMNPLSTIFMFNIEHISSHKLFWIIIGLTDVMFLVDVIVNLYSGYYSHKKQAIILEPELIWRRYLKFYFWIDLLGSNVIELVMKKPYHTLGYCVEKKIFIAPCFWDAYNIISNIKLFRFGTFLQYTDRFIVQDLNIPPSTFKVIRLLLISMFSLHWAASIVFLIERTYAAREENAINDYQEKTIVLKALNFPLFPLSSDFWENDTGKKYMACLFRATYTLTSFGHELDEDVLTFAYIYLTISLIMLGYYLKIYILSKVLMFTKNIYDSSIKYYQSRYKLKAYMKCRRLPESTQERLFNFFDFRLQKRHYKELKILRLLGGPLKQEILLHSCRQLVEAVPLFSKMPGYLLTRVVECLKIESYLENDVIVKAGESGTTMYFIVSGTVAIYTSSGVEVSHLEDYAYFGEITLLLEEEKRTASVVATETCELYALTRNDFMKALASFPELVDDMKNTAKNRLKMTANAEIEQMIQSSNAQ